MLQIPPEDRRRALPAQDLAPVGCAEYPCSAMERQAMVFAVFALYVAGIERHPHARCEGASRAILRGLPLGRQRSLARDDARERVANRRERDQERIPRLFHLDAVEPAKIPA